jgi:hypothetical protein
MCLGKKNEEGRQIFVEIGGGGGGGSAPAAAGGEYYRP